MKLKSVVAITLALLALSAAHASDAVSRSRTPTVVLVHGAFADTSSWNGVIPELVSDGYQ